MSTFDHADPSPETDALVCPAESVRADWAGVGSIGMLSALGLLREPDQLSKG